MQTNNPTKFLRFVLWLDAVSCAAMGMLMAFGGSTLESYLNISPAHLFYAGLSLLAFAAFVVYAAARKEMSAAFVWTIIVVNVIWTLDSFIILMSGQITPNSSGLALVIAQALVVGLLAVLEFLGWNKTKAIAESLNSL